MHVSVCVSEPPIIRKTEPSITALWADRALTRSPIFDQLNSESKRAIVVETSVRIFLLFFQIELTFDETKNKKKTLSVIKLFEPKSLPPKI